MKNIEEKIFRNCNIKLNKILIFDEKINQLENKRNKLLSEQKLQDRKKRGKRFYKKGAVFKNIFTKSKDLGKGEFYKPIIFLNFKEGVNQKILKIIEKREKSENQNIKTQEEQMDI